MPDYGPDPHRSVSGSFAPGANTGLIHHPIAPGTSSENHWPWAIPSALLISAQLGSLAPGDYEKVWLTERDGKPGDGFWFSASRSSGAGSTVNLKFGLSDGLPGAESGNLLVPWVDAGHVYSWAQRATGPHPFATGTVYASGSCSVLSTTYNFSGESGGAVFQTWGNTGSVPSTAKSDARVLAVQSWWRVTPSTEAPTGEQLSERIKQITCPAVWRVGRVGFGTRGEWT